MNGDLQGKIGRVVRELQQLKYQGVVDEVGLRLGDPVPFLPLLHFILLKYSRHVAQCILKAGYELHGKTDHKFVEGAFRLFRDCFRIKTVLTPANFLEQGFAERKLILISDVVQVCKKIHNDELRKERLAALKPKQGSPSAVAARSPSTERTSPGVKVIKAVKDSKAPQVTHVTPTPAGSTQARRNGRNGSTPRGTKPWTSDQHGDTSVGLTPGSFAVVSHVPRGSAHGFGDSPDSQDVTFKPHSISLSSMATPIHSWFVNSAFSHQLPTNHLETPLGNGLSAGQDDLMPDQDTFAKPVGFPGNGLLNRAAGNPYLQLPSKPAQPPQKRADDDVSPPRGSNSKLQQRTPGQPQQQPSSSTRSQRDVPGVWSRPRVVSTTHQLGRPAARGSELLVTAGFKSVQDILGSSSDDESEMCDEMTARAQYAARFKQTSASAGDGHHHHGGDGIDVGDGGGGGGGGGGGCAPTQQHMQYDAQHSAAGGGVAVVAGRGGAEDGADDDDVAAGGDTPRDGDTQQHVLISQHEYPDPHPQQQHQNWHDQQAHHQHAHQHAQHEYHHEHHHHQQGHAWLQQQQHDERTHHPTQTADPGDASQQAHDDTWWQSQLGGVQEEASWGSEPSTQHLPTPWGRTQPMDTCAATQPTVLHATQPTVLHATQPAVLHATQPAVLHATQPTVLHATQPAVLHATQPAVLHATQPAVLHATQPAVLHATQPTVLHATQPAVLHATQPAVLHATQPAVLHATQPAVLHATQPTVLHATQPAVLHATQQHTGLPASALPLSSRYLDRQEAAGMPVVVEGLAAAAATTSAAATPAGTAATTTATGTAAAVAAAVPHTRVPAGSAAVAAAGGRVVQDDPLTRALQQQVAELQRLLASAESQAEQTRHDASHTHEELRARMTVLEGRVRHLECELEGCVRRGEYHYQARGDNPGVSSHVRVSPAGSQTSRQQQHEQQQQQQREHHHQQQREQHHHQQQQHQGYHQQQQHQGYQQQPQHQGHQQQQQGHHQQQQGHHQQQRQDQQQGPPEVVVGLGTSDVQSPPPPGAAPVALSSIPPPPHSAALSLMTQAGAGYDTWQHYMRGHAPGGNGGDVGGDVSVLANTGSRRSTSGWYMTSAARDSVTVSSSAVLQQPALSRVLHAPAPNVCVSNSWSAPNPCFSFQPERLMAEVSAALLEEETVDGNGDGARSQPDHQDAQLEPAQGAHDPAQPAVPPPVAHLQRWGGLPSSSFQNSSSLQLPSSFHNSTSLGDDTPVQLAHQGARSSYMTNTSATSANTTAYRSVRHDQPQDSLTMPTTSGVSSSLRTSQLLSRAPAPLLPTFQLHNLSSTQPRQAVASDDYADVSGRAVQLAHTTPAPPAATTTAEPVTAATINPASSTKQLISSLQSRYTEAQSFLSELRRR